MQKYLICSTKGMVSEIWWNYIKQTCSALERYLPSSGDKITKNLYPKLNALVNALYDFLSMCCTEDTLKIVPGNNGPENSLLDYRSQSVKTFCMPSFSHPPVSDSVLTSLFAVPILYSVSVHRIIPCPVISSHRSIPVTELNLLLAGSGWESFKRTKAFNDATFENIDLNEQKNYRKV